MQAIERDAAIDIGLCKIPIEPDRLIEVGNRAGRLAAAVRCDPALPIGFGIMRLRFISLRIKSLDVRSLVLGSLGIRSFGINSLGIASLGIVRSGILPGGRREVRWQRRLPERWLHRPLSGRQPCPPLAQRRPA